MAVETVDGSIGDGGETAGASPVFTVGEPLRTSTVFACIAALCNTILGISVVTTPGAFARAGCVTGTLFLVMFSVTSGCGLHLLARSSMTVTASEMALKGPGSASDAKDRMSSSSFREVAIVALAESPRWAFLIDLAVAIKCFGVATSYLILVGSLMHSVMGEILGEDTRYRLWLDRRLWVTVGFSLAASLAGSRTLGALRHVATLAIGLVVMVMGMVLSFWLLPTLDACPGEEDLAGVGGFGGDEDDVTRRGSLLPSSVASAGWEDGDAGARNTSAQDVGVSGRVGDAESCFDEPKLVGSVITLLQTLPIFIFCFTCHQNIFTICNEIVQPTPGRIDTVIVCAMFITLSIYMVLAWGAYATFGDSVTDDLLDIYPTSSFLTFAKICVSMLVTTCYPLQVHPCRLCLISVLNGSSREPKEREGGHGHHDRQGFPGFAAFSSGSQGYDPVSLRVGDEDAEGDRRLDREDGGPSKSEHKGGGGVPRDGGGQDAGEQGSIGAVEERALEGRGVSDGSERDEENSNPEDAALLSEFPRGGLSDQGPTTVPVGVSKGGGDGGRQGVSSSREAPASGGVAGPPAEDGAKTAVSFWSTPEGFQHVAVTAMILLPSYLIALSVDSLGLVLSVVGATGSTTIAFILPGLLYLKVHPEPHPKRSLAMMQLMAGIFVMPVALTSIAIGGGE